MVAFQRGPIDCSVAVPDVDLSGRVAVVTGGSNGIGAEYVRRLATAGARVAIGDLDEEGAKALQKQFGDKVSYSKCNVTSWADQVALFQAALKFTGKIDIVIANAGVAGGDDSIAKQELDQEIPPEPALRCLDINLTGVIYTTKLALHFFQRQHARTASSPSTVLLLQGSLAGYLPIPSAAQYVSSKYALRGLYRSLQIPASRHNTRINYIAPWFVRTSIIGSPLGALLDTKGDEGFAELEDVGSAMMRFVGGEGSGRTLTVVPRKFARDSGVVDLDIDDYEDEGRRELLGTLLGFVEGWMGGGGTARVEGGEGGKGAGSKPSI